MAFDKMKEQLIKGQKPSAVKSVMNMLCGARATGDL